MIPQAKLKIYAAPLRNNELRNNSSLVNINFLFIIGSVNDNAMINCSMSVLIILYFVTSPAYLLGLG